MTPVSSPAGAVLQHIGNEGVQYGYRTYGFA